MRADRTISIAVATLLLAACDRQAGQPPGGASADLYSRSSGKETASRVAAPASEPAGADTDTLASAPNPEEQGASKQDLQITRLISQAIASDPEFSTKAKSVKVVTVNGKVTLRGAVASVQEQRSIASIARRATGAVSVDNQMEVKP